LIAFLGAGRRGVACDDDRRDPQRNATRSTPQRQRNCYLLAVQTNL